MIEVYQIPCGYVVRVTTLENTWITFTLSERKRFSFMFVGGLYALSVIALPDNLSQHQIAVFI